MKKFEATFNRLTFAVLSWELGFILIHTIVNILARGFLDNAHLFSGIMTSWILWFIALAFTVRFFLVSVPEYTGLVTVSALSGDLHAYLTGMHFRFPWEQVKKEDYVSTELISVPFNEHFPTKDGGVVRISGSYEYRVDTRPDRNYEMLRTYIGIDESTIVLGVYNRVQAVLTKFVGNHETSAIKDRTEEIQTELNARFQGQAVADIEAGYGIEVASVKAGNVEYIGETQTALSASLKAKKAIDAGKDLAGVKPGKKMKPNQIEDALVLVGSATKAIHKYEIGGLDTLTPEAAQAVASVAQALLQSQGRFGGRRGQGGRQGQGDQGNNPVLTPAPTPVAPIAQPPVAPTGGIGAGPMP